MKEKVQRSARLGASQVFASVVQVLPQASNPLFGIVRNVSASGICVETLQAPIVPGTVRVSASIGERVFELSMRIARVSTRAGTHEVGLRFERGDPQRAEFLRAFLDSHGHSG